MLRQRHSTAALVPAPVLLHAFPGRMDGTPRPIAAAAGSSRRLRRHARTHAHETERRPCTCASRAQARTRLTRLATMQRLALHATPGGGTTPRGASTSTEQAHRSDYDLTLTYS